MLPLHALLRSYTIAFPVWTVLGLFFFTQGLMQGALSGVTYPWWHSLIAWLSGVWISALLTPAVFSLADRFPFRRTNWIRRSAFHFLLSVCFSFMHIALHTLVLATAHVFPDLMKDLASTFAVLTVLGFHSILITYWVLLGICYGAGYYRASQERQREALRLQLHASDLRGQLVNARLSALKAQLHPHFLFNTLNAIMVLVRKGKTGDAERMLTLLSDLLRIVLDDVDAQEVPLRQELEFLQIYLSIEEIRFQDRLRVTIDSSPDVLDAAFPQMALQPIVENAIRHGIGRRSGAGRIEIRARRHDKDLIVTVRDDGPGLQSPIVDGCGIGLRNTRARLEELHGSAAELCIEDADPGAIVTMRLPYTLRGEEEVMEPRAVHNADR